MIAQPTPSADRPRAGHHSYRNQDRALMYLGADGAMTALSVLDARRLISACGSVRGAARLLGLPKSTLHDLAKNTGKQGRRR